jgi:S-adenosylmethionine decarboxylase proenzyme
MDKHMKTPNRNPLGRHWLVELQECTTAILREVAEVERIMRAAAATANASIVSGHFHQFQPYGVSGVLVIEESHFTIHTWPEHAYAAIDIFTCSPDLEVELAIGQLQTDFGAQQMEVQLFKRGSLLMV